MAENTQNGRNSRRVESSSIAVPTTESGEEFSIRALSFFLFFTQNEVPQMIIGMVRVPREGSTPSQFWLPNFSNGFPFGKLLLHPFLADQPQKFLKAVLAQILLFLFFGGWGWVDLLKKRNFS